MHTNDTCYIQSDQECQSQAAELSQSTAARFCCHISHPVPILWNMNRHRQWNARSHIFQQLTLTRFVFFFTFSSSLFLLRDSPVVNLLKVIRFSFETSLVKWDNYSDQAVPSRRCWIFLIICLRWMMPSCICISVVAAIHASCFFFVFFFSPPVNRGFSKDFGKKGPSAMPSTPGGASKVVPIASLNPYQSKWVWLQFIPKEAQFCFHSSAGEDCLWEQVDLLSAGVAANVSNDRVLLKRAQAADSWRP